MNRNSNDIYDGLTWLQWRGAFDDELRFAFRWQAQVFGTYLLEGARRLKAEGVTKAEVPGKIRRLADSVWRRYRMRIYVVEQLTTPGFFHSPVEVLSLVADAVRMGFDEAAAPARRAQLQKSHEDLAVIQSGLALLSLRVVYCPDEAVGHPLDEIFWTRTTPMVCMRLEKAKDSPHLESASSSTK